MASNTTIQEITSQLTENMAFGKIKKIAKEIGIDHQLALKLWESEVVTSRLLSILIMDNKLEQEFVESIANDLKIHEIDDRNRITDWLLANKLMKNKSNKQLLLMWEKHSSPALRRLYWYYQARLRWTGKNPMENDEELLTLIEEKMINEVPEVQWAMNFTAAQIGIFESDYRDRCIELGKRLGLYEDEIVPKNCTPNYLPEFIRIEVNKRKT